MRKLLYFTGITLLSTLILTGCNKPTPSDVDLKLSAATTEVAPGKTIQFMVTSDVAPNADIVISVSSDNTSVATVPASVTLRANEKAVTDVITGIAEGEATVTISADGVTISENSVKIKVSKDAPSPEPVPEKPALVLSTEKAKIYTGETMKFTISTVKAPEKDIVIKIKSSDVNIFTVTESLTLEAGKTSVEGTLTAVAVGSGKISIEAEGIDIQTGSKDVTIEKAPALELSISASNKTVYVGMEREFTITTPLAPSENIVISLISSNPDAIGFVDQTITLASGEKSVKGKVKGIAEGTSQISFTTAPETPIVTGSVEFTSEILVADIKPLETEGIFASPEHIWEPFGMIGGDYAMGGMFYHSHPWEQQYGFEVFKTSVDTYGGNFVGTLFNNYGVFTSIDEGTPIDENLAWVETERGSFPSFWSEEGYTIGNGEHFVVCELMHSSSQAVTYPRAWLKVSVAGSKVTLLDGAVCLNEAPFSVGEK